jgi:hypothetical protein
MGSTLRNQDTNRVLIIEIPNRDRSDSESEGRESDQRRRSAPGPSADRKILPNSGALMVPMLPAW